MHSSMRDKRFDRSRTGGKKKKEKETRGGQTCVANYNTQSRASYS